ncbi:MAG TPA: hypothetical protein VGK67_37605 [Myxococcales bacterium]|jgi:hypothetical protein
MVGQAECTEGADLVATCDSAFADVDHVETEGAACGEARVGPGGVHLEGAAVGTCHFVLVSRTGARQELTAEFGASSCHEKKFYGVITSPLPQFCPDAGPCAGQTSCFVDPGGWGEIGLCSLRCVPDNGLSCAVPVMGARPGECAAACACIQGDNVDGCKADSDCVISPADCCGCARGGRSWAILAGFKDKWEYNLCTQYGADKNCDDRDDRCTPGATAICDNGRCLIGARDGGL